MYEIVLLFLVSLLWGITNPVLKRGGSGIEHIKREGKLSEILAKLRFMIFNWKCVAPLVLNQVGSLIYYAALSVADISIAVPVANSLTLLVTTVTGSYLGERIKRGQIFGSVLIISGVCLCILGKA